MVAELVRIGLQSYTSFSDEIDAAMRRIQVAHADHREYLSGAADQSFDQVYFDPMFDQPLKRSRHIDSLRPLACADPLTPEAMQEARRVARRRVVIKSRAGSDTLEQLGVTRFSGGRWSAIVYGIIPVG